MALAAALACSDGPAQSCPGEQVPSLVLRGVRESAGCAGGAPFSEELPAEIAVPGILSHDPHTGTAAFCGGGEHAAILYGARTGDAFSVSAASGLAVLGACGTSCTAATLQTIAGTLHRADDGAPDGLDGTWVERMEYAAGACDACALPCEVVYRLSP